MMKNLNFENTNEIVSMANEELLSVDGGYSWAEFKQDVADFCGGISEGFSNPRK